MTAINASGYGIAVVTPSELLDCRSSCSVTWEMSTERTSFRDWPDVWITPWADNLTLPIDGEVDLQGMPRNTIHVDAANTQNTFVLKGMVNGKGFEAIKPWSSPSMSNGIAAGTNEAAIRQTFRLSLTLNRVRLERLGSSTATPLVFWDLPIAGEDLKNFHRDDLVVQFAHHSYTPTKSDSCGNVCRPNTWHWANFNLSPSRPFSLIQGPRVTNGGTVKFDQPAPPNSFLRFSALCRVTIDGKPVERQTFLGQTAHMSSYFVPIPVGKQSFEIRFSPEGDCGHGAAKDIAIWAKSERTASTADTHRSSAYFSCTVETPPAAGSTG
jgi:hypothetical protein